MRLPVYQLLRNWGKDKIEAFNRDVHQAVSHLVRVLNGNVGFGDGTDYDNIKGEWITFTSDVVAGAENMIPHSLGMVPVGFILMVPPVTGTVNKGATPWTTSHIFLTCSAASQTVTLFLIPDSSGAS
jgi:hypothetical protein